MILDDGKFEVLLIRSPTSLPELNAVLTAIIARTPNDKVLSFQASSLHLHCDQSVAWTLDGEFGGEHMDVDIDVMLQAVRMIRGGDLP